MEKPSAPAIIVIFGITGDLAQRKLLPALYHLFRDNVVHEKTVIIGISRRDVSTETMLQQVEASVVAADEEACQQAPLERLQAALQMHTMSQVEAAEYIELKRMLDAIEAEKGVCMDRLYYLSIPPQMFEPIVRNLGEQHLNESCQHGEAATRLLIEKPFGYDLKSAQDLMQEIGEWFQEDQIFRIDHYLAKDPVQNILEFRKQNPEIEKLWNSDHIDEIEVTVREQLGIEGRAIFYEEVGALRDFVQSHLLQMLAFTAMDIPDENASRSVHHNRLELLESIEPISETSVNTHAFRGQYEDYRQETGNQDSHIETFAKVQLTIANKRWQGTKIVLQTGKALAKKEAYIRLVFKSPEHDTSPALVFHVQPDTGISVEPLVAPLTNYALTVTAFNQSHPATIENVLGYERVFLDAIRGDHTIFTTNEEIIAAWKIVNDILPVWSASDEGLVLYPKGSEAVEF